MCGEGGGWHKYLDFKLHQSMRARARFHLQSIYHLLASLWEALIGLHVSGTIYYPLLCNSIVWRFYIIVVCFSNIYSSMCVFCHCLGLKLT